MTNELTDQLAADWSAQLLAEGYCLIPDLLPAETIAALDGDLARDFDQIPFCEGHFYGEQTKRFGRVLARSPRAAKLVQHELIIAIVETVLGPWCDCIQLNLTQAIAVHPGAKAQMPHRDQDMWRGEDRHMEYLVNVMWPFTDYTRDNGATRVWPESHGLRAIAVDESGPFETPEYGPGSALLMLGSLLHAAGANMSQHVRRGMITGYSLGWLNPFENQHLAYPPEVAKAFSPELAALVGYRQHRPNLGNYEGHCPSVLLADRPGGLSGARDALRPDQVEAVARHAFEQGRPLAA